MRQLAVSLLIACIAGVGTAGERAARDIIVYGGTSGGVTAAIQAARLGKSVQLIEPGGHFGGMTSGGLGWTDTGNPATIGGIAREFYRRIYRYYENPDAWKYEKRSAHLESIKGRRQAPYEGMMFTFEPHVAEKILNEMVRQAGVEVVFGERLDLKTGVEKSGNHIRRIVMESGRTFSGRVFIDATYEGDLMAAAGVSYHVGRESNETYGEFLGGVQKGMSPAHNFTGPVDPYLVEGDTSSGLLPGINPDVPGENGQGDQRVQAYCYRMCLTDEPSNRVPFPKPKDYDPRRYELLARYLKSDWDSPFKKFDPVPNRKTDTNNHGAVSTDYIGMNYDYPDGDYHTRARIIHAHLSYQQGLMWFLANDPRVPAELREQMSRWGLAKDEFPDTGHWPHQLYVREARRMIGSYVMTELNCRRRRIAEDPVGLASYGMDSHHVQRYVTPQGSVQNEGNLGGGVGNPYPISYRSLVPKEAECSNLLVPVCLSASHIAYGSIRMEPVYMILGQSAATAAAIAIDENRSVGDVDYQRLHRQLLRDGQILEFGGLEKAAIWQSSRALEGVVRDDRQAELTGIWKPSGTVTGYVDVGYIHDENSRKGEAEARFVLPLERPGRYEVRIAYSALKNRASNVPVRIVTADGVITRSVNQQKTPPIEGLWLSLGTFSFNAENPAEVIISNENTDGYVIVDAVQLLERF